MKKLVCFFTCLLVAASLVQAQIIDPVKWQFSAKKTGAQSYDLVITATLEKPWHIYSQNTGEGPVPTSFSFKKNPLITFTGNVKEEGKLIKEMDKNFNSMVSSYEGKVVFVQKITTKGSIKTNVAGEVEYMVCNNNRCLPPTKKTFNIKL